MGLLFGVDGDILYAHTGGRTTMVARDPGEQGLISPTFI